MQMEKLKLVSNSAGETVVGYSNKINGTIVAIHYDGGFDGTAGFTITAEDTLRGLWQQAAIPAAALSLYPVVGTSSAAGVAALYAAAGTAVNTRIPIVDERIKFSIATPGVSKTANFRVYFE